MILMFSDHFKIIRMDDWRNGSQNLDIMMTRFYGSQAFSDSTDVIFKLPDGSEVKAHKLILSVSSEVFHSQFFGPLADRTVETVEVTDSVDSEAFRIMIESVYKSGDVPPDLEISEYLDLLKAANFYILHDIIGECNWRLCRYVKSLEIQELIDWTHMTSHLSIHDQVYKSCRETILKKLSSIIKEDKWYCISTKVQNELLEDLENIDVWKGDLLLYLRVLKRLSSLELNSLLPDRILKFNSNLEMYFESTEHYQEFIVDRSKWAISRHSHDLSWSDYDELDAKLKNHLNSIETQGSVLSQLYSLLKGDGLDLDRQFKWEADYFSIPIDLEVNGVDWGTEGRKDKEHYWRLLKFANQHQLDNLKDHCYLRLFDVMLEAFPVQLAHYTNRASQTPGGEELFKLGIHVFLNVTMEWKWLDNPYVDVDNLMYGLSDESKTAMNANFFKGCITFNEEAIKSISKQLKTISDSYGDLIVVVGIAKWCRAHSSSLEDFKDKFRMMVGESEKVMEEMKEMGIIYNIYNEDE